MTPTHHFPEFEAKMKASGFKFSSIQAFRSSYDRLVAGDSGLIPEDSIRPVETLPEFDPARYRPDPALLEKTVVIKLNGGLGTSMGLEDPKSLLTIKEDHTFLDIIVRQIMHLREAHQSRLRFLLMNSFSTSEPTLRSLRRYPDLETDLELMQSAIPKVDAQSMRPVEWPSNPQLEWCPPGHGDIYPSLVSSGWLDRLLNEGVRYAFVSNADNLGASLDLGLLAHFAESQAPFMMEVCGRTPSDRKGGHLAQRPGGGLLLRESAQCPGEDLEQFQDIDRHRFFNTNNLWIDLPQLKDAIEKKGGVLPLPLIKNRKTVDPRDKASPEVFQLETAMGAAIAVFESAAAVVVPRSRFAPVKTTSDLLVVLSDAYELTEDWRIELVAGRTTPPSVSLDPAHYKLVDQLNEKLKGCPSLRQCERLEVMGPVGLSAGLTAKGKVTLRNEGAEVKWIGDPPVTIENQSITV